MRYLQSVEVLLGGQKLTVAAWPLLSRKIIVVAEPCLVRAGTEFYGKALARDTEIEQGSILYSRWIERNGQSVQIYHWSKSLYDALRAQEHTAHSEERAAARVRLSIETALAVVRDLVAHGRHLTDQQQARLRRLLARLQVRYERARKEALQAAHAQIAAASTLRDSLGRRNYGMAAARVTKSRAHFDVRLEEITAIVPNISRFRIAVLQELARIWWFLEQCQPLLEQVRCQIPFVRHEYELRSIRIVLQMVYAHILTIHAAPFQRNCAYLADELDDALRALQDTKTSPQKRAWNIDRLVRIMLASLDFKRAQRELERIIYRTSLGMERKTLSPMHQQQLAVATERFRTQVVRRLDESVFRRKRLAKVDIDLREAARAFQAANPEVAKEKLKAASALL